MNTKNVSPITFGKLVYRKTDKNELHTKDLIEHDRFLPEAIEKLDKKCLDLDLGGLMGIEGWSNTENIVVWKRTEKPIYNHIIESEVYNLDNKHLNIVKEIYKLVMPYAYNFKEAIFGLLKDEKLDKNEHFKEIYIDYDGKNADVQALLNHDEIERLNHIKEYLQGYIENYITEEEEGITWTTSKCVNEEITKPMGAIKNFLEPMSPDIGYSATNKSKADPVKPYLLIEYRKGNKYRQTLWEGDLKDFLNNLVPTGVSPQKQLFNLLNKRNRKFDSLGNEKYAKEVFEKVFVPKLTNEVNNDSGQCNLAEQLDNLVQTTSKKDVFNISYGENNNIDKLSRYLNNDEMNRLASLIEFTNNYTNYVQNSQYHIYLNTDRNGKQSIQVKYVIDGSEQELFLQEDLKTFLNKTKTSKDLKYWFIGECIQKDAEKRQELNIRV